MCSTAEVYWQKKTTTKSREKKKRTGCPSNHRVFVHAASVCVNTHIGQLLCMCTHKNTIDFLVHVLWNPTTDSLHRTKGEASMWNKQYSNFNFRQAQWLEEMSEEGHKFKILRIFKQDKEVLPVCLLSASKLKISVLSHENIWVAHNEM